MASQEPNIGLNYGWSQGESGWGVQMDENLRALGALLHLEVLSRSVSDPTTLTPSDGDRYLIASGAVDVWSGHDGKIARYMLGAWELHTPKAGWRCVIVDENVLVRYDGAAWVGLPTEATIGDGALEASKMADLAPDLATTTGLTFGYKGGRLRNDNVVHVVSAGTITLTASATNYVELDAAGVVSANTTGFNLGSIPLFEVVTDASTITSVVDSRAWISMDGVSVKNNDTATTDPTVTDDSDAGYSVGSRWINTTTGELFRCIDATAGAAVWTKTTLTIDELGSAATADTTDFDAAGTAASEVSDHETTYDHAAYDSHLASTANPHNTTAAQVGAYTQTEVDNALSANSTADRDRANHTGTQTLSTISDAGTAAALDSTTSVTDTTQGRVLRVGDFGVGVGIYVGGQDLNTITDPGFYHINDSNPNRPFGDKTNFGNMIVSRGYDTIMQIIGDINSTYLCWRSGNPSDVGGSGSWGPWERIATSSNPYFSVMPQVAGDPIVERGSNANGEYVRFADGTQICYSTIEMSYTDSGRISNNWTYPAAFVVAPDYIGVTLNIGSFYQNCTPNVDEASNSFYESNSTTSVILRQFRIEGGTNFASGDFSAAMAIAAGRWK